MVEVHFKFEDVLSAIQKSKRHPEFKSAHSREKRRYRSTVRINLFYFTFLHYMHKGMFAVENYLQQDCSCFCVMFTENYSQQRGEKYFPNSLTKFVLFLHLLKKGIMMNLSQNVMVLTFSFCFVHMVNSTQQQFQNFHGMQIRTYQIIPIGKFSLCMKTITIS